MFRGKFGAEAENIPMEWHWYKIVLRIGSRRGVAKEELGYPRGSFQVLIDALENAIKKQGGKIFLGATVKRIVVENGVATGLQLAEDETSQRAARELTSLKFDRVICTAPSFAALKITRWLARRLCCQDERGKIHGGGSRHLETQAIALADLLA